MQQINEPKHFGTMDKSEHDAWRKVCSSCPNVALNERNSTAHNPLKDLGKVEDCNFDATHPSNTKKSFKAQNKRLKVSHSPNMLGGKSQGDRFNTRKRRENAEKLAHNVERKNELDSHKEAVPFSCVPSYDFDPNSKEAIKERAIVKRDTLKRQGIKVSNYRAKEVAKEQQKAQSGSKLRTNGGKAKRGRRVVLVNP